MPHISIPRTIRVVVKAHRGSDARANVLHFQTSGTSVTQAEVVNAASWVTNWVTTGYKNMVSSAVVFDQVQAIDISVPDGFQIVTSLGSVAGAQPQPAMPANACMVVTTHTAQGGRTGRGRIFCMEAPLSALQSDDTFASTWITSVQAVMNSLLTVPAPDLQVVPAVCSRKGLCSFPITSLIAHTYVASMRDRLPGHRARRHHHI
jgi:hypothetical protein